MQNPIQYIGRHFKDKSGNIYKVTGLYQNKGFKIALYNKKGNIAATPGIKTWLTYEDFEVLAIQQEGLLPP